MSAGGAEREARAFDFECTRADDHDYENCEKCARMRKKLTVALAKVANQARLEALEQAAQAIEEHKGGYTASLEGDFLAPDADGPWGINRDFAGIVRALKAAHAPLDQKGGPHAT